MLIRYTTSDAVSHRHVRLQQSDAYFMPLHTSLECVRSHASQSADELQPFPGFTIYLFPKDSHFRLSRNFPVPSNPESFAFQYTLGRTRSYCESEPLHLYASKIRCTPAILSSTRLLTCVCCHCIRLPRSNELRWRDGHFCPWLNSILRETAFGYFIVTTFWTAKMNFDRLLSLHLLKLKLPA